MPSGSGSRGRRPRPPAEPPVVQVSSSSSSEEGGSSSSSEEEDESEGSSAGARGRPGSATGRDSAREAEVEGPCLPSCPICYNEWTADGAHRVSCIPCGHVYGRSCLERWLLQSPKRKAPCPQCGRKYKQNHIINPYVPEIAIPNKDHEKQVLSLREKIEFLEKERQIIVQQNIIS